MLATIEIKYNYTMPDGTTGHNTTYAKTRAQTRQGIARACRKALREDMQTHGMVEATAYLTKLFKWGD